MIIDFDNLTDEQLKIFNSLVSESVEDYNALSIQLLENGPDTIQWYTHNLTSRYPVLSNFLYHVKCLNFINCLLEKGYSIEFIKTSDPILYKTVRSKFVAYRTRSDLFYVLKLYVNGIKWFLMYFVWCISSLMSRSKDRKDKICSKKKIIIVDTFISKLKDGKYNDRYYGDVFSELEPDVQDRTFYLPQYLPLPSKKTLDNATKKSKENLIFISDFLKVSDYLYSIFSRIVSPGYKKSLNYKGFNLEYVLRDCERRNFLFGYFCRAQLYERFFLRLNENHVDLRLFIDWFENQSYDKACYYALNKYFPEAKAHGFIGFISHPLDFPEVIASNDELNKSIAPSKLFVCCKAFKDLYIKSGYKGMIELAPLFRAQNVWNYHRNPKKAKQIKVLIPLGLIKYEVYYKINFVVNYLSQESLDVEFLVKPHPAFDINDIKRIIPKNITNISIVEGDIYSYLMDCDVIMGSNSTTLYEALALGIPVISVLDSCGKLFINKPLSVKDDMWYEVISSTDLSFAIEKIKRLNFSYLVSEGDRIKDYYFEKISKDKINNLFDINGI